ncbi:hypothetical protein JCM8097_004380 [Rhodosporidiobolus ruineniae]
MSTAPLVLVRDNVDTSATHPLGGRRSTFVDEQSGTELFTAEHRSSPSLSSAETSLWQDGVLLGRVSLASLDFDPGCGGKVLASKFYSRPHIFSSNQLFKLGECGIRAYWKMSEKDGSLLQHKTKAILVTVEVVGREEGVLRPTRTRITVSPTILDASPSFTRSMLRLPASPTSSSSPSFSPSASSTDATRASSPISSHTSHEKGKGKAVELDADTHATVQPIQPVSGPEPLAVVLLSLLHQDYLAADKAQRKEVHEMEEPGDEYEASAWQPTMRLLASRTLLPLARGDLLRSINKRDDEGVLHAVRPRWLRTPSAVQGLQRVVPRRRWLVRLVVLIATLIFLNKVSLSPPSSSAQLSVFHFQLFTPSSSSSATPAQPLNPRFAPSSDPWIVNLEERLQNAPKPPYRYLVGTMERNEALDITEWLLYHIAMGFEHFVVFDHGSTDGTLAKLTPFVQLGWVTLLDWSSSSGEYPQWRAYNQFMSDYKRQAKFQLFFDADEFVVRNQTLLAGTGELDEPFMDWFDRKYSQYGSIVLPRRSMTSNGHYRRPDDLLIASYTEMRGVFDHTFYLGKHVSQSRMLLDGTTLHDSVVAKPYLSVDPNGKAGDRKWEDKGDYPVYMHHVWSKSWEECVGKIKQTAFPDSWRERMGDKFCREQMRGMPEFDELPHVNDTDTNLVSYVAPRLRTALKRWEARNAAGGAG